MACLQANIQHQTLLEVTLVTKQIKNKTSHMYAASKLTWTYSKCAHNLNTTLWQNEVFHFLLPINSYLLAR